MSQTIGTFKPSSLKISHSTQNMSQWCNFLVNQFFYLKVLHSIIAKNKQIHVPKYISLKDRQPASKLHFFFLFFTLHKPKCTTKSLLSHLYLMMKTAISKKHVTSLSSIYANHHTETAIENLFCRLR